MSKMSKLTLCLTTIIFVASVGAQTLPSETPKELKPTNDGFEYTRRDVMIPMRDGVKLHTVIIVPTERRTLQSF